jgi:hypothetical protein
MPKFSVSLLPKLRSNLGPIAAEHQLKRASLTQNQTKRINNMHQFKLVRDQGFRLRRVEGAISDPGQSAFKAKPSPLLCRSDNKQLEAFDRV